MKINIKNILIFIIIIFIVLLTIFSIYYIYPKYKSYIISIKVAEDDKIKLKKQLEDQKTDKTKQDNSNHNIVFVCDKIDCIVEKFKNCESGQYVIDPKIQYKAYFLISGFINNKCVVLVEKDMKNGTLCKIPKDILRDKNLLNNLLNYKFNSVKSYCETISAGKNN